MILRIVKKTLIFLFAFSFFSCKLITDSVNSPVRAYFTEYTGTSGIMDYSLSISDFLTADDGTLIVPSDRDLDVRLLLRNPQNFTFVDHQNMTFGLSLSADDRNKAALLFGSAPDPSLVTIEQDSKDKSILHLVYPAEFLRKVETGFEITPTIELRHPITNITFGSFTPVRIICNSPPPKIYGAAVYKDSFSPQKYVVRFNMPGKQLMKATHFDIKTLTINGEESSVTVNKGDGTFTFSNPKFSAGTPSITVNPCSVIFQAHGQESYFLTDDIDSGKYKSYTITLKDEKGLSSSVLIAVNTKQLAPVVITEKKDALQTPLDSTPRRILQDDGKESAAIVITPAAKDSEDKDTSDSVVSYELYDTSNVLLRAGKNNGGKFELELPAGNYSLKAYSHKENYADSLPVEVKFNIIRTNLFVSSSGKDSNPGDKIRPLKTIGKAFDRCVSAGFDMTITLLSELTDTSPVSYSGADKILVDGKNHSLKSTLTFGAGTEITLKDVEIQGEINISGKLLLSGNTCVKMPDGSSVGKINFKPPNLFVTVSPDLSQNEVAELSWDSDMDSHYKKDTKVIVSSPGTLTQALCDKFTTKDYVIVKDGDEGKLKASGGSIGVDEPSTDIKLSMKSDASDGKYRKTSKGTLSAKKGSEPISVSEWTVKVFTHGGTDITDKFTKSGNVITFPDNIATGVKLRIIVTAKVESISHSATFSVTIEE